MNLVQRALSLIADILDLVRITLDGQCLIHLQPLNPADHIRREPISFLRLASMSGTLQYCNAVQDA